MGVCYFFRGEPTQLRVFKKYPRDLCTMTLVYASDKLQLGFDADSTGGLAAKTIVDSGIYFQRHTGLLARYPNDPVNVISAIRMDCTVGIVASETRLEQYLQESLAYQKSQIRKKLNQNYRSVVASNDERPAIFTVYDAVADVLDIEKDRLEAFEIEVAINWKFSDFGLHCYASASSEEILSNLIKNLQLVSGLNLFECPSESVLPVT